MRRAVFSIALGTLCVVCAAVSHAGQVTQPMNVSLTIGTPGGQVSLVVGALTLTGISSTQAYGSASLNVNAASGLAYSIALNGGLHMQTGSSVRFLQGSAGLVPYALFRDAAATLLWGDGTSLGPTVTGIGTGSGQAYSVYGGADWSSVTVADGTYTDVVTVAVNF